jgi:hypothetical protein
MPVKVKLSGNSSEAGLRAAVAEPLVAKADYDAATILASTPHTGFGSDQTVKTPDERSEPGLACRASRKNPLPFGAGRWGPGKSTKS